MVRLSQRTPDEGVTAINFADKHFEATLSNCSQQLLGVINSEGKNNRPVFCSCTKLFTDRNDQFMSQAERNKQLLHTQLALSVFILFNLVLFNGH